MKSIHLLLCFITLSLMSTGCNQKAADQAADTKPVVEQPKASEPSTTPANGGHDYTFLTYKMLKYRAALVPGQDPKDQPFQGQWIKLDKDGTYKEGKYDKQTHTGKWTYNHDATTLLLQPDTKEVKPSEWKIIFNDDMIVFIGTDTYGNTGTQIQMVRIDKFPEKE